MINGVINWLRDYERSFYRCPTESHAIYGSMGTAFRHLSPSFAMSAELTTFLFSFQGFLSLIVLLLSLYVSSFFLFRDVCVSDPEKKAVLITGCDSGFGYELAKKLDARGLRVFASCLTSEGQAKLRSECSPQLSTLKLDVTEPSDVQNAVEFVMSRLPPQGINLAGQSCMINSAC